MRSEPDPGRDSRTAHPSSDTGPPNDPGSPSRPGGPSLLPALELVTAWTHAHNDPGFYWAAVERVMGDVTGPDAPPAALAALIFGLSSLGGILLDRLAEESGQEPSQLLTAIQLTHDAS
jgi:hypothetical protein